jgi:membrane fusion protein (multidrug efflux system)
MSEELELAKAQKKEHPRVTTFGVLVVAAVCLGVGWLAREAVPEKREAPAAAAQAALAAAMGQQVPAVDVQTVRAAAVNPPREYIARVEPIQDVALRAQVDGYIKQVHFTEGSLVQAGDLLFTIDPEQYEARIGVRNAEIGVAEADLDRAERLLKRLEASDPRAVILSDLDKARADVASAKAAIAMAKSNLVLAEIDLKHTKIVAPITGRIGRTVANVGDYVSPSIGALVRVVQTDPIRVAFSMTDKDYLKVRENMEDATARNALRFRVKLPTGTIPPFTGRRDFEDNTMSADTATLSVRVRFDNREGLLVPDGYVTMLVDLVNPEKVPVVPQEAVLTDAEGTYVFVIDAQGKAEQRRVELGAKENGMIVVPKGLQAGERLATLGAQKLAPGMPVAVDAGEAAKEAAQQ